MYFNDRFQLNFQGHPFPQFYITELLLFNFLLFPPISPHLFSHLTSPPISFFLYHFLVYCCLCCSLSPCHFSNPSLSSPYSLLFFLFALFSHYRPVIFFCLLASVSLSLYYSVWVLVLSDPSCFTDIIQETRKLLMGSPPHTLSVCVLVYLPVPVILGVNITVLVHH